MTETRMNVQLDMELTPDLLIGMQDGPEASLDHVVGDVLVPDRGYAGLLATFAGTVVTVGAGRLYQGGKVYAFDTPQSFDVLAKSKLPVATKRIMLLVAYGTEQDSAPEQVNFLVEAQSTPSAPVYKPQAMATEHQRIAVVQDAYGDEAPNPAYPGTGLALPVAVAVLVPTGIESLVNILDGKVPNLADIAERVAAIEAFDAEIGPEVATLTATLAGLQATPGINQALLGRILSLIADLNAKQGIDTHAADASSDYLLDGSNSDLAHPLSSCRVYDGVRFPDDAANDAPLNLLDPFEKAGVVKGGVLFPAYDRYLRLSTGPRTGAVIANSYSYHQQTYVQKTMSRTRTRYGDPFTVCSNSSFWSTGAYDPFTGIFTRPNGDQFRAVEDLKAEQDFAYANNGMFHVFYRVEQFWTDTVSTPYWDVEVGAPQTVGGYHLAMTRVIGQDHWVDAIGINLGLLDAQGDLAVMVCEAGDNAIPNTSKVLASTTIPFASLKAGVENVAQFATPVLFQGGKRIAVLIVTTGSHHIWTTDAANFPSATFFALAPSGFAIADPTRVPCMNFYGCKFKQAAVSINLQNLQLGGGIVGIDVLAASIVPSSTALTYEVQLGGVWTPLSGITAGALNAGGALNPNVPLRATFSGTVDMMPCLSLVTSNAHVHRPKTATSHVWPLLPRTPPVSSAQIRVIQRYERYDPAQHSWGVKLLTGAGYLTQTAPSSFSDVAKDSGVVERTYVFNLPAAVASYKVLTLGAITTPLRGNHVAWIKDYVL